MNKLPMNPKEIENITLDMINLTKKAEKLTECPDNPLAWLAALSSIAESASATARIITGHLRVDEIIEQAKRKHDK
jgi:hypothetical protein